MSRLLVLVVEDEPSVMAFLRAALERGGYEVDAAENGTRALEMLGRRNYGGVISDMRTPGGVDGAGVWEWVSIHRPELMKKLIFITGDIVNEETAASLRRTGAPFVEKPFRVQELIRTVERIFGKAE